MLRRIYVDNFKALRDFEVHLDGDLTLFAGENGSGKSSVLEALEMFILMRMWGWNFFSGAPNTSRSVDRPRDLQFLELDVELRRAEVFTYRVELETDTEGICRVFSERVTRGGSALLETTRDGLDLRVTIGGTATVMRSDLLALPQVGAMQPDLARLRRALEQLRTVNAAPHHQRTDRRGPPYGLGDLASLPAWLRYLQSAQPGARGRARELTTQRHHRV